MISEVDLKDYKEAGFKQPANEKQIAGNHYKRYGDLQPWDVVLQWNMGYLDGTALKYLARWRDKNGVEDLQKAIHFIEKLIETENGKSKPNYPAM